MAVARRALDALSWDAIASRAEGDGSAPIEAPKGELDDPVARLWAATAHRP